MALDFLGNIGKFAETVNSAAGPIQQILGAIRGSNRETSQGSSLRDDIINRATNFPQSEAERRALSLLKALGTPDSSLVKHMVAEELQNLHSGVQSDIRSKVLSDRRERSMGRSNTFFDPERTDENIAFQISRGTPMLKQQAQQNAIQRILEAAGVGKYAATADARNQGNLNAMASVYAMDNLQPNQGGGQQMQSQMPGVLGRAQAGLSGLDQILKIFKESAPEWMEKYGRTPGIVPGHKYGPPEEIRWNQMRYNG